MVLDTKKTLYRLMARPRRKQPRERDATPLVALIGTEKAPEVERRHGSQVRQSFLRAKQLAATNDLRFADVWRAFYELTRDGYALRDRHVLDRARKLTEARTTEACVAWERAGERLLEELPDQTYDLWIRGIEVVGVESDQLVLRAPERKSDWTRRRFGALLSEVVRSDSDFEGVVIRN